MEGMEIDNPSNEDLSNLNNELIAKIFHSTSARYSNDKKIEIANAVLKQNTNQSHKKGESQKQLFFILNKEQFLLEWVINVVVKSSTYSPSNKGNIEINQQPFLQEKYWKLIAEILSSQSLPQFVLIWANLITAISNSISLLHLSQDDSSSILKELAFIFDKLFTKFQSSFRPSVEQFISFLETLLKSVQQNSSLIKDASFQQILTQALSVFLVFERQQFNQKKIFGLVVSKLLEPFIRFYFTTKKHLKDESNSSISSILELLEKVTIQCLFKSSNITDFVLAFSPVASKSTKAEENGKPSKKAKTNSGAETHNHQAASQKGNYQKQLFDKLKEIVAISNDSSLEVFSFLPLLFRGFLDAIRNKTEPLESLQSKRKDKSTSLSLDFAFFVEVASLEQDFIFSDIQDMHRIDSLHKLNELIALVRSREIYKVNEDTETLEKFNFLSSICKKSLSLFDKHKKIASSALFDELFVTFEHLLQLNHLVIEPHLELLWGILWANDYDASKSPAIQFAISLLKTYGDLRQLDRLLTIIFNSISVPKSSKAFLASNEYFIEFSRSITELPVGQIPVVWELFQTEASNYLPAVINFQDDPSSNETRFSKLHHFIQMFTAFIANVSVSSQNAESIIAQSKNTASTFLNAALSVYLTAKRSQTQPPSFLPWFLGLYNELLTLVENAKLYLPSHIHILDPFFYLIDDSKKISILEFINQFSIADNLNTRLIADELVIKRAASISCFIQSTNFYEADSETIKILQEEFTSLINHISSELQNANFHCQCSQSVSQFPRNSKSNLFWNGKFIKISDITFRECFWSSIVSNLLILGEHLDRKLFLDILLEPCSCSPASLPDVNNTSSIGHTSSYLLTRAIFYEIQAFREIMMDSILAKVWNQIGANQNSGTAVNEALKYLKIIIFGKSKKVGEAISQIHQLLSDQKISPKEQIATEMSWKNILALLKLVVAFPKLYFNPSQLKKYYGVVLAIEFIALKSSAIPSDVKRTLAKITKEFSALFPEIFSEVISVEMLLSLLSTQDSKEDALETESHYIKYHAEKSYLETTSDSSTHLKKTFENISELSDPSFRYKFIKTLREVLTEKEQGCIQIIKQKKEENPKFKVPELWTKFVRKLERSISKSIESIANTNSTQVYTLWKPATVVLDFGRLCVSEFAESTSKTKENPMLQYIGLLLSSITSYLVSKEEERNENTTTEAVDFLEVFARSFRNFYPTLHLKHYEKFLALLHHLLVNNMENKLFERLITVYTYLIQNSSLDQLSVIIKSLKTELSSSGKRLEIAVHCCCQLISIIKGNKRISLLNKSSSTLIIKILSILNKEEISRSTIQKSIEILISFVSREYFQLSIRDISAVMHTLNVYYLTKHTLDENQFNKLYLLLYSTIKFRSKETYRVIPTFIAHTRHLLSAATSQDLHLPITCAQNLARLYEEIGRHQPFRKYCIYLLVDFIKLIQTSSLAQEVKSAIMPGAYTLMDACSNYEFQQLYTILDSTGKTIFRAIHSQYDKDHKFKGKT